MEALTTTPKLANHSIAVYIDNRPGVPAYWDIHDGAYGRVRQAHAHAARVRATDPGAIVLVTTTLIGR